MSGFSPSSWPSPVKGGEHQKNAPVLPGRSCSCRHGCYRCETSQKNCGVAEPLDQLLLWICAMNEPLRSQTV